MFILRVIIALALMARVSSFFPSPRGSSKYVIATRAESESGRNFEIDVINNCTNHFTIVESLDLLHLDFLFLISCILRYQMERYFLIFSGPKKNLTAVQRYYIFQV